MGSSLEGNYGATNKEPHYKVPLVNYHDLYGSQSLHPQNEINII